MDYNEARLMIDLVEDDTEDIQQEQIQLQLELNELMYQLDQEARVPTLEDYELDSLKRELQSCEDTLSSLAEDFNTLQEKINSIIREDYSFPSLTDTIKTLCQQQGFSVAALERTIGVSNGQIRRWATSTPSLDKIVKVADFFNVSVDVLINRKLSNTFDFTKYSLNSLLTPVSPVFIEDGVEGVKFLNSEEKSMLFDIARYLNIPDSKSEYRVKAGDNLYRIATKFKTSVEKIKVLNSLNTDEVSVGQLLLIPSTQK